MTCRPLVTPPSFLGRNEAHQSEWLGPRLAGNSPTVRIGSFAAAMRGSQNGIESIDLGFALGIEERLVDGTSLRGLGFMAMLVGLTVWTACNLTVQDGQGDNTNTNVNSNDNSGANGNDNTSANDNGVDNGNDTGVDPDLALFTDADSGFSTTVVRDVDDETVQFSLSARSIVYQDGTEYQAGTWTINGNFLAGGSFQVRFGSVGGEKRAYFTETGPGTVCDFRVTSDRFEIFATSQVPPQE